MLEIMTARGFAEPTQYPWRLAVTTVWLKPVLFIDMAGRPVGPPSGGVCNSLRHLAPLESRPSCASTSTQLQ